MSIAAFLSDFDGTLVQRDILDVVCGIVGKEQESRQLNKEFIAGKRDGLPTLKKRIDFLDGISAGQIRSKIGENDFLVPGARELFQYLRERGTITVLHSGNIIPVLEYYQDMLSITHIVGTSPRMDGDKILGIELVDFKDRNFKAMGCRAVLDEYGIEKDQVVAIGDSPSDAAVFDMAGVAIAIDPKGDIADKADYVVEDLFEVINILGEL